MDKRISEMLLVFFVAFGLLLTHYRARMFTTSQSDFKVVHLKKLSHASVLPGLPGEENVRRNH